MEQTVAKDIKINGPIEFQSITDMSVNESVNKHARLHIRGIINTNCLENARNLPLLDKPLTVYKEQDDNGDILFSGLIENIKFESCGKVSSILIEAVSTSILFDRDRNKRSFQNTNQTYAEIASVIAGEGRAVISITGNNSGPGYPLIQYEETDWEFLLRLAGYQNTVLIPDSLSIYPQIAVGIPRGTLYQPVNLTDYKIKCDSGIYYGHDGVRKKPHDRVISTICCEENMSLGDKVRFKGDTWTIFEKNITLENGMIQIQYALGKEGAYSLAPQYNKKIQGVSLIGEVLWRKGENIGLRLEIDNNQKDSEAFAYPYMPETGNLMYSMPEKGARASLYFPDADEKNAVVINCRREETVHYQNTRLKCLETSNEKSMELAPSYMQFNTYKRNELQYLGLNDSSGITISGKDVLIEADEILSIEAGRSCSVSGNSSMVLSQTKTDNKIEMYGNNIIMTAEKYLTAAAKQKNLMTTPPVKSMTPPECSETYGALLGALSYGLLDENQARLMAGIPCAGAANGRITAGGLIGWGSRSQ